MNYKNKETDTGSYINGIYTTKNGFSGSGLNCPKGTRLYNTEVIQPFFFMPEDRGETEDFEMITQDVCPGILPYYAVSNYGRILNVNSGKIMKENFRPNGYSYYCLSAENCKYGQKKYNTNRIVMKTFEPREDADKLQVNHINGNKGDNYINKTMPDGSIQSNIEWSTPSENITHAHTNNLNVHNRLSFTEDEINEIRFLRNQGYSYNKIRELYPDAAYVTIQSICRNEIYVDDNYTPAKFNPYENIEYNHLKISDHDAEVIRTLSKNGIKNIDIKRNYFPNVSESTISDIVRGVSHNRPV